MTDAPAHANPGRPGRSPRSVAAVALVVLTSISIVLSTVGLWLHAVVYDTDRFMEVVSPVFDDPAVIDGLSVRLGDGVVEALAIEERVEDALTGVDDFLREQLIELLDLGDRATDLLGRLDTPRLADLAPPIVAAFEAQVRGVVDAFVRSDLFQERLPAAVAVAHEHAVALLREDYDQIPNLVVDTGEVRLNLIPLIVEAIELVVREGLDLLGFDTELPAFPEAEQVEASIDRLADALGRELPPDFGQVTVMTTESLSDVQAVARNFDRLIWLDIVLTVGLVVLTVVVALRRRRTVVQLALGAAIALVVAFLVIGRIEQRIIDSVRSPQGQEATAAVVGNVIENLRGVAVLVFVAALLIALVAHVAGKPRWVSAGRDLVTGSGPPTDADRFAARHHDALRLAAAVLGLVALWAVGLSWVTVIVIGLVVAVVLVGLAAMADRATPAKAAAEVDATS